MNTAFHHTIDYGQTTSCYSRLIYRTTILYSYPHETDSRSRKKRSIRRRSLRNLYNCERGGQACAARGVCPRSCCRRKPIGFHDEALRAQAIAARTFALRTTEGGKKPILPTVSAQVYKTAAERKERWGKEFKQNEKRLREIIATTAGDTIVHGDELYCYVFFHLEWKDGDCEKL